MVESAADGHHQEGGEKKWKKSHFHISDHNERCFVSPLSSFCKLSDAKFPVQCSHISVPGVEEAG